MKIVKIISGGQTGADRAALDVAIELGIPHGGWCPKGRRAEDGVIPDCYQLQETDSPEYDVRTEANVLASDLTLIFSRGPLTGGSLLTEQLAGQHGKPCVHMDLSEESLDSVADWFETFTFPSEVVLNVAGPRASSDSEIYHQVCCVLRELFDACALSFGSDENR
jgi:hypothetical protein